MRTAVEADADIPDAPEPVITFFEPSKPQASDFLELKPATMLTDDGRSNLLTKMTGVVDSSITDEWTKEQWKSWEEQRLVAAKQFVGGERQLWDGEKEGKIHEAYQLLRMNESHTPKTEKDVMAQLSDRILPPPSGEGQTRVNA